MALAIGFRRSRQRGDATQMLENMKLQQALDSVVLAQALIRSPPRFSLHSAGGTLSETLKGVETAIAGMEPRSEENVELLHRVKEQVAAAWGELGARQQDLYGAQ